jgi:hypothetical protein
MEFNIQPNDRRLFANNYRALWSARGTLHRRGIDLRCQQAHWAQAHPERDASLTPAVR